MTQFWGREAGHRETYETDAPWVTWTWLSTDRETRFTGRMRVRLTCCICGETEIIRLRIPRFGPVPTPVGGVHPARHQAKDRHAHPGLRDPADWKLPLRNWAAWPQGVPLGLFQRLAETAVIEANEQPE